MVKEGQEQVESWIRQQAAVMEIFRNSLVPFKQEANLLQVPNTSPISPKNSSVEHITQLFTNPTNSGGMTLINAGGPIRPATLWRRSRSETDVSVPINDAAYICELCGQVIINDIKIINLSNIVPNLLIFLSIKYRLNVPATNLFLLS